MQAQELVLVELMKVCIRTMVINREEQMQHPIIALFGTQLGDLNN